jgi:peptidoglycan/xylan/chitin deacetylase (PgdA/CDA1 family)
MSGWGPQGHQAAVSFSFDNLGEAAEVEFGNWPSDKPIGSHPSVRLALPAILGALRDRPGHATFFFEAWNLDVYPEAFADIAADGHEIACHGYRHEIWVELDRQTEERTLAKALDAYRAHRFDVSGLRPPASILTDSTIEIAREQGLDYLSPVHCDAGIADGVAVLPVDFPVADLTYYQPEFAAFRAIPGDEPVMDPDRLVQGFSNALERVIAAGGYVSVLFHPFQFLVDGKVAGDRIAAMAAVWDGIASDDRVWFAPCGDVARWMLGHPAEVPAVRYERPEAFRPQSFFRDMDLSR